MGRKHEHDFSALWWHFGRFGRQDVHLHPCASERCATELVGVGHDCGGKGTEHIEKRLGQAWSNHTHEGEPLAETVAAPGGNRP